MSDIKKSKGLKDRLQKKKKELHEKGGKRGIVFLKEGTLRVRILPVGADNDFAYEIVSFYLGGEIQGVYSPATVGKPCAIMEKYEALSKSKKPGDKELAKLLIPKKKYVIPCVIYADTKGEKVDKEKTGKTGKLVQLTSGLYEAIIDLYLDEDDWGDMTHPTEGYDLKLIRTGTGKFDTEYNATACKNSKTPKEFRSEVNLEEMVAQILPSYEETQEVLQQFLENIPEDEDDDKKDKKRDKKKKDKKRDKK